MAREPVFYSFHFQNDVFRVQQVRNMGVVDGNEPVAPNDWEEVKRKGDTAIRNWIDEHMKYRRCVVVLVGTETSNRPWIRYEIEKAWNSKKGLLGIHVHNFKCPKNGICAKGINPFSRFSVGNRSLADFVPCYDPDPADAYAVVSKNLQSWVSAAIAAALRR